MKSQFLAGQGRSATGRVAWMAGRSAAVARFCRGGKRDAVKGFKRLKHALERRLFPPLRALFTLEGGLCRLMAEMLAAMLAFGCMRSPCAALPCYE